MESTPNFGYPYPGDLDSNDIHAHLQLLALALDTAGSLQGRLESRPAAGKRGQFYWATNRTDPFTGATVAWNVLYRDDGANWQQLNTSAPQQWTPSITMTDGGGGAVNNVAFTIQNTPTTQYWVKPAKEIEFEIHAGVKLSGTQRPCGAIFTLPVMGDTVQRPHPADFFNDSARAISATNALEVYPYGAYNASGGEPTPIGQWPVDNFARWCRVRGTYRAA